MLNAKPKRATCSQICTIPFVPHSCDSPELTDLCCDDGPSRQSSRQPLQATQHRGSGLHRAATTRHSVRHHQIMQHPRYSRADRYQRLSNFCTPPAGSRAGRRSCRACQTTLRHDSSVLWHPRSHSRPAGRRRHQKLKSPRSPPGAGPPRCPGCPTTARRDCSLP